MRKNHDLLIKKYYMVVSMIQSVSIIKEQTDDPSWISLAMCAIDVLDEIESLSHDEAFEDIAVEFSELKRADLMKMVSTGESLKDENINQMVLVSGQMHSLINSLDEYRSYA